MGERLEDAKDRLDRSGLSVNRAGEALGETAREDARSGGRRDPGRGGAGQDREAIGE